MHLTTHASNDASPPEFKKLLHIFFPIGPLAHKARWQQVMPDDHSEVEPLLPIPNRTVKRFSADDSEHLARESRSSSGKLHSNPQD